MLDELKYFQKKYSFDIKILSDSKFILPEYKIDLLNKSKKLINSFENINTIIKTKKIKRNIKDKNKDATKSKEKIKKTKSRKTIKTLWVRRKKKN